MRRATGAATTPAGSFGLGRQQRRARAGRALAVSAAVALTLGACSQISALAPVGGDAIAEVRYGAIDVLLAEGVDVLEAPTCNTASASAAPASAAPATAAATSTPASATGDGGSLVTCTGSTVTGEAITVASSTSADARLDVRVGDRSLYSGPLQSVLDEAARS